jgi:hypothetical protein
MMLDGLDSASNFSQLFSNAVRAASAASKGLASLLVRPIPKIAEGKVITKEIHSNHCTISSNESRCWL